jgi:5'-methylthioadenosine phosphorylase
MAEKINIEHLDTEVEVGITGGYGMSTAINNERVVEFTTQFGKPSYPIILGEISGTDVLFIPRHSKGHTIPSHEVNYRANLYAMYSLGVNYIISAIAAGSLNKHISPGSVVFPTDYINETTDRKDTFFDDYPVYHFSSVDPFCENMINIAIEEAEEVGLSSVSPATATIIEGPRFATRAESHKYRSFGADIINMSMYPEVALARELEICFLNLALITDYDIGDVGGIGAEPVNLEMIDEVQSKYKDKSTQLIKNITSRLPLDSPNCCGGYREKAHKKNHPEWDHYNTK